MILYTLWYLSQYLESVTQLTLAQSAPAAMWLWTNSWVCLECLWVIFGSNILFAGAYVLAGEDADGAAQGERWCMQQIVAPAAFLAAEADNSDGFRLKAPQIPPPPHSWATSNVCVTHPLVACPPLNAKRGTVSMETTSGSIFFFLWPELRALCCLYFPPMKCTANKRVLVISCILGPVCRAACLRGGSTVCVNNWMVVG